MNLNEAIQTATDNFVETKLPALVEEKVSKMVDGILDGIFQTYSDTGKSIKQKIEEQLDVNLQCFSMVDYNAMISQAIVKNLDHLININSIEPIVKMTKEALGYIPEKKIKLSEIHEMIVKTLMDNDDDSEGEFSLHFSPSSGYDWMTVSFDTEPDVKARDCSIEFMYNTSKTRGTIFSFKAKSDLSKKGNITPAKMMQLDSLERKIFRLYSAQVEIETDTIDLENYWNKYN